MAFKTYQCNQYIKYMKQHIKEEEKIYKLIEESPFTITQIANALELPFHTYRQRYMKKKLTEENIINILEFIK